MVIRKLPGQRKYRLISSTGRNLGTYGTRAGAEAREKQVNFFKFRAARFGKRK